MLHDELWWKGQAALHKKYDPHLILTRTITPLLQILKEHLPHVGEQPAESLRVDGHPDEQFRLQVILPVISI